MVRALEIPGFKSRSDHLLDLFQLAPGSTPPMRLYKVMSYKYSQ